MGGSCETSWDSKIMDGSCETSLDSKIMGGSSETTDVMLAATVPQPFHGVGRFSAGLHPCVRR